MPQPDGPSSVTNSPFLTFKETSDKAVKFQEKGLASILISNEQLLGNYLAKDVKGNDGNIIVGAGFGLSFSLARLFHKEGMKVSLAARNIDKLKELSSKIDANIYQCDSSEVSEVENLFNILDTQIGTPDLVIYNPSARVRGPIGELNPNEVKKALEITSFGGFLVAQEAAKRMMKRGSGSIFFTGATAGVKGFSNSSVFAMGKFALRGLAQSLARELHPKNIHIGHFVIDGGISKSKYFGDNNNENDALLDPDEIAKTYLNFYKQNKSAWSWEIEIRPWVEKF